MSNFANNPTLKTIIYFFLMVSCGMQITNELGMHGFGLLKAHHGIFLFALMGILDSYGDLVGNFQSIKKKKT
jgi:hypothetical protein